MKIMESKF